MFKSKCYKTGSSSRADLDEIMAPLEPPLYRKIEGGHGLAPEEPPEMSYVAFIEFVERWFFTLSSVFTGLCQQ